MFCPLPDAAAEAQSPGMNALPILAAISSSTLVNAVIWVIVAGVIFGLLFWLIDYVGLPAPFNKVAKVIIAIAAVIILINALMMLVGRPFITF